MMKNHLKFTLYLVLVLISSSLSGQTNTENEAWLLPFESDSNESIDYPSLISFIYRLTDASEFIFLDTFGFTDGNHVIHRLLIADQPYRNGHEARRNGKVVIWINNGIHPGESAGIDATCALLRDWHLNNRLKDLVKDLVIVIIPAYNVDGMINRNSTSRVNQNGPKAYGFRANARNLDLNRDFIKAKSSASKAFNRQFTDWLPDIFLDNHTSNGADYQHNMTIIPTQPDQLGGPKGQFLRSTLLPFLYEEMAARNDPMTPYVQSLKGDPLNGIIGFFDSPRYSSGYAAIHGSLSLMTEAHMLKPFKDRINSTYRFMDILIDFAIKNNTILEGLREEHYLIQQHYPIGYELNRNRSDTVIFHGYELSYEYSDITGSDIRRYDRSKPYQASIPYYSYYTAVDSIKVPEYYIIPKAWQDAIDLLRLNGVTLHSVKKDTTIDVDSYMIKAYNNDRLFEGQPYHSTVDLELISNSVHLSKGDYVIPTRQKRMRYIIETLEPKAKDSFFRWNFFDQILQRKEYFSDYLFEPLASQILEENNDLRKAFKQKIQTDQTFANSPYKRLEYIYENSPYAEPGYLVYPVKRAELNPQLFNQIIKGE